MNKINTILFLCLVLLTVSCGEQHKAESLVKDFIKENTVGESYDFDKFSKISTTAMITKERVQQMHKEMENLPFVKKNVRYDKGILPDTLLYIKANYRLKNEKGDEEEYTQTFYMDKEISRIISFKQY